MLDPAIARFAPKVPLAVALSGGADSTALLVACTAKWPGQVRAVHVHHGLQAAADAFEQHCERLCQKLSVPLAVRRVDARHSAGQSPEDAARRARYAAIGDAVRSEWPGETPCDVALAQHADDQAETVLLALSRGAGLPGLAAMPTRWERDGIVWHRPLLSVPASAIRAWLLERDIAWIEDPTNSDERFVRNRIRARVLPALDQALPQFREMFARSARHAAQAQALLNEVAADDLLRVGIPPSIASLRLLSHARQANALRHWMRTSHELAPSAAQLDELLAQVADCVTRGHDIRIKIASGFVVRDGAHLQFEP